MRASGLWILLAPVLLAPLQGQSSQDRPNVVLITIDTIRSDYIGCYGDDLAGTPSMDSLAADGVRFESVTAQVPLTLPSHSTIMTGTYPANHGVRDNVGHLLSDDRLTLAEVLREAGYRTAGFVAAFVLASRTGIAQGFEHFSEDFKIDRAERKFINLGYVERLAEDVVDDVLEWISTHRTEPLFVWIHLFDPHDPYQPP